jgi:hypothetical protein
MLNPKSLFLLLYLLPTSVIAAQDIPQEVIVPLAELEQRSAELAPVVELKTIRAADYSSRELIPLRDRLFSWLDRLLGRSKTAFNFQVDDPTVTFERLNWHLFGRLLERTQQCEGISVDARTAEHLRSTQASHPTQPIPLPARCHNTIEQ